MRTNHLPKCLASVICASAMLLQISPAMAGDDAQQPADRSHVHEMDPHRLS